MLIAETPNSVADLDLMKRLADYANGKASYLADGSLLGPAARSQCSALYVNLQRIVDDVLAYLLNRVTTREMETFTLHDAAHGRKVAHLMWNILDESRRLALTPPEIGLLILSAHLHDAGMGLSPEDRRQRLAYQSELWAQLDYDYATRQRFDGIKDELSHELAEQRRHQLEQELFQAEEALLCLDTRERHATKERYSEYVAMLENMNVADPLRIPSISHAASFAGDSYLNQLIDVCVSHNQDATVLADRHQSNPAVERFPTAFPVGNTSADIRLVAATLRLADILDFDRERTPTVLFHYLLPTTLNLENDRSVLEWRKHMAISNWVIEQEGSLVFRGRSTSHVIHHAVVLFCSTIEREILETKAAWGATNVKTSPLPWPFILSGNVRTEIYSDGYRYLPYRFELDNRKIYSLLMGQAIYDSPLAAIRELVQNSIDACKVKDAYVRLQGQGVIPSTEGRIFLSYDESTASRTYLSIRDSGIGMDRLAEPPREKWRL